ncbi:uncharacterized protein [Hetaerina americana]|uniref:uncharacterized protein n=1 Tax=Hetaerina americana TaxID=62018 RepID=UPI003A7F5352
MYKTVRHGENSLQYTILPQEGDEESGKSGGGQGGKSGGGSGSKGGGSRTTGNNNGGGRGCCRPRTALFLVLTALLIGVVTASVAVPLLLTTDLLSLPGEAFPFTQHRSQNLVRPHQYQHHPAYNASAFRRRLTPANTATPTPTSTTTPSAAVTTPASPTANPESPTTPLPSTEKPASAGSGREPEEMPAAPGPPDDARGGDVHSTTASVPAPSKVKGLDDDEDEDDLEDEEEDEEEEEERVPPVAVPIDERPDDEDDEDDEGEGPSADGPAAAHTASTEAVRGDAAGYLAAPAAPSPPGGGGSNASRSATIWVTPPRNSTRNDGGYLMAQVPPYGSTPEVSAAVADEGDPSTDLPGGSTTTTTATTAAAVPQMPVATATTPPRTSTFPAAPTDGAKYGNKHNAWEGSGWLLTDPSSYLQWTGYNRDGLLLPVVLGTVVILIPATIAVCFMIIRRRRRQKDLRRETIGKIASDLQYGDKATLLADASEEE